ncbi:MAG: dependent oxidoreductase [Proteobacteria bacterium]|nr:dependent oxidoreductase [Pseudomonadota bacterium]
MRERHPDVVVVGGGLVGLAIAHGLLRQKLRVTVCDEGDRDFRASRGNFGLVWVQGKGVNSPPYARLTSHSARLWPDYARQLQRDSGIDPGHTRRGGLSLCLEIDELAEKSAAMAALKAHTPGFDYEVLDAAGVRRFLPGASPDIAGGIYSPQDGHVNPLQTLHALLAAFEALGGTYLPRCRVDDVSHRAGAFSLTTSGPTLQTARIVLAAGLGNARLAPLVGLYAPVLPVRGQVMITERVAPFLPYPTTSVRQTTEGTVQIGDSQERVGLDDGTLPEVLVNMARRAIALFPLLRSAQVVRTWGALRIMTPDGLPLYEESRSHPGAFVATCHSGVTLAAAHSELIAPWIAGNDAPTLLETFDGARFAL